MTLSNAWLNKAAIVTKVIPNDRKQTAYIVRVEKGVPSTFLQVVKLTGYSGHFNDQRQGRNDRSYSIRQGNTKIRTYRNLPGGT